MDNGSESGQEEGDFVETLRELMRSWRLPEWAIERDLPTVLRVCEGVGIVRVTEEGYEPTELVADPKAWEQVTKHLKEAGIIGSQGS